MLYGVGCGGQGHPSTGQRCVPVLVDRRTLYMAGGAIFHRNIPAKDRGPEDVVPLFKVHPERSRREAYTTDVAGYSARLAVPSLPYSSTAWMVAR